MELEKFDIPSNPYFTFVIDMLDVGLQLRINDIPVFADTEGGEANVEVPVNEYIVQNNNSIDLAINTVEQENEFRSHAECNISLCVRSKNEDKRKRRALWVLNASPAELSILDKESKKPESRISRCSHEYVLSKQLSNFVSVSSSVNIEHSIPVWAWQNGQQIDNNDENFSSLLDEYRKLHTHLQNKDLEILKNYTRIKADEFAKAYHMPSVDDGEKLVSLVDEVEKDSQTLHKFWEKGMKLEVYGNGRLARIVDDEEDSPIVFLFKEGSAAKVLKLAFCRNDKDAWVLIR